MVNTGAACGSTAGSTRFKACCSSEEQEPAIDLSYATTCYFETEPANVFEIASINFLTWNMCLSSDVHIHNDDTPFFFSIMDHKKRLEI